MLHRLIERFRSGAWSPVDETRKRLARIEERNGALHAWTEVFRSEALDQAEASTVRWREGRPLSPLDGVGVAVKDIIDVAGHATRAGVTWRDEPVASDAAIVRRLRELGLVLLGKTVTTALACFDPPPTIHPLDPQCTPGGSSSGSAVGVADGHCVVALGTQTGGSIIRPASYCGVVGFKPTFGRLPLDGIVPVSTHLDHLGFLTATPRDAAIVWGVLQDGATPCDGPLAPRVVADARDVYSERADTEVVAVHDGAVADVERRGVRVEPVVLPWDWDDALAEHRTIMAVEAAAAHGEALRRHADVFPPQVGGLIEEGLRTDHRRYERALACQQAWQREFESWWESGPWDALVMPSTPTTAPRDRTTTGDPGLNSVWTMLGVPVLTTPVRDDRGPLPCGVQWIGRPCDDGRICRIGWWYLS